MSIEQMIQVKTSNFALWLLVWFVVPLALERPLLSLAECLLKPRHVRQSINAVEKFDPDESLWKNPFSFAAYEPGSSKGTWSGVCDKTLSTAKCYYIHSKVPSFIYTEHMCGVYASVGLYNVHAHNNHANYISGQITIFNFSCSHTKPLQAMLISS